MDEAIDRMLEANPDPEAMRRIELGANHEEQHQELLLTDILHAFYTNPLRPAYIPLDLEKQASPAEAQPLRFIKLNGGLVDVGFSGSGILLRQ